MTGNVANYFGYNFGLGPTKISTISNQNILDDQTVKPHERVMDIKTTSAPVLDTNWSLQDHLNAAASRKLQSTRDAVTLLKDELNPIVGRNSFIASKVELMTQYLQTVNSVMKHVHVSELDYLSALDFVKLVDDLQEPPSVEEGGKNSLEYTTMKLLLEKYKLIELQNEVFDYVFQQDYSETQL